MNCQTGSCRTSADEYILYGCLNQHLHEKALCAEHFAKWTWVQIKYKHTCGECNQLIEDYLTKRIHHG